MRTAERPCQPAEVPHATKSDFAYDIEITATTAGFTGYICLYKLQDGQWTELECDSAVGGLTIGYNLDTLDTSAGAYGFRIASDSLLSPLGTGTFSITVRKK